ncbi:protein kinase domain-containing protein [Desulfosediminicola ganghwensis]|uniref:protein kinase domain-containing protein n=1 Tax=Desulfosediminicola ganghwensis TaxID=2569540 RepID=UPI0010AD4737|nr:protein kinase [Desulfosediminicola ganghwensis]
MNRAGRYEIIGRLGRGGMSTVYKARAPITGRIVALKILRPRDEIFVDLVGEQRLREIFVEEARIMGEISHDHIAKIIDCDEDNGIPFIVLEYYSHSIGDLIGEAYEVEYDSREVSIARTVHYTRQALQGLERLHFAGIIHRDIKPFNLMLTDDDRVKIIDFGLSRVRGEEKMSIPGMQVGSPYYAAPEQERDPAKADARADLYAVGVLLYRMLTGRLVDMSAEIAVPSNLNSELDEAWDQFLLKSIAKDPEQRFQSALEMRVALEQLFSNWQVGSEDRCALLSKSNGAAARPIPAEPLIEIPSRIMYKDMRQRCGLDDLFRPIQWFDHPLETINPHLLQDPVTGLWWQRCGSGFALDWQQAHEYVEHLNLNNFQAKSNWRLPTVEELVSILRAPTAYREFCLPPQFEPGLHWLWSADHCTQKAAWMADIMESYIGRLDKDGTATVCAVSCDR